ncbi:MAG: single-stranded DNA-binding protein [Oscillospiraceae bacterium]
MQRRRADFIDIVAWRSTAEFVSKILLQRAAWRWSPAGCRSAPGRTKDGNKRRSAEVVADNVYFGESKRDSESSGGYSAGNGYNTGNNYGASGGYGSAAIPPLPLLRLCALASRACVGLLPCSEDDDAASSVLKSDRIFQ